MTIWMKRELTFDAWSATAITLNTGRSDMQRRPAVFPFLSVLFLGIALSLPLQVMWIYGHGFDEMDAVLNKLTIFNWLVMISLVITAVLLWTASPALKIFAPL